MPEPEYRAFAPVGGVPASRGSDNDISLAGDGLDLTIPGDAALLGRPQQDCLSGLCVLTHPAVGQRDGCRISCAAVGDSARIVAVLLEHHLLRRLYGDWFVGFRLTPRSDACDRTASSVRPSLSPITRVGVFCCASCRSCWLSPRDHALPWLPGVCSCRCPSLEGVRRQRHRVDNALPGDSPSGGALCAVRYGGRTRLQSCTGPVCRLTPMVGALLSTRVSISHPLRDVHILCTSG
ncbi:hypothetical protein A3Q40_02948 [Rhodococcus sp. PBTS 1]|nr:hypothetical protein A3Q40_02948 [Rhodococcus sp. PBTS 1]